MIAVAVTVLGVVLFVAFLLLHAWLFGARPY